MPPTPSNPLSFRNVRRLSKKLSRYIMRSNRIRLSNRDTPIRIRVWFIFFTAIIMIVLGFLGFTESFKPLNDKLLHFFCFFLATGIFYFIFDVEEDARRIWFWRHSSLLFTIFTCLFCGGIVSEFIQASLPFKTLEFADIIANLLGASLGLYISYHLERYYRRRREISRLYRPISTSGSLSDLGEENEDVGLGTPLLPTSHPTVFRPKLKDRLMHLTDVWDEREELFGVGDDSDNEASSKQLSRSDVNATLKPKISI